MVSSAKFQIIKGTEVTEVQLDQCATLFSEHYGIWAKNAPPPLRQNKRVKMSAKKLRQMCLSNPADTLLLMAFKDDRHVGQAFITKWAYQDQVVAWVTQLVVHNEHRKRYIATAMVSMIKGTEWFQPVTIIGIASSHPAACNTLAKIARLSTTQVDLDFIQQHTGAILACTPVEYLKGKPLHGELFGESCTDGAVSLVDTDYYVDHAEPQDVLNTYVTANKWKLGALREGHEFVLIMSVPLQEHTPFIVPA